MQPTASRVHGMTCRKYKTYFTFSIFRGKNKWKNSDLQGCSLDPLHILNWLYIRHSYVVMIIIRTYLAGSLQVVYPLVEADRSFLQTIWNYIQGTQNQSLADITFLKGLLRQQHFSLTLSWRRPLSYKNQYIDLRSKSMA